MSKHPPNFLPMVQDSAEWLQARVGHVTASRVAAVIGRLKSGKPTAEYENYKMETLTEILTGQNVEHYVSPYMDFGKEYEGVARAQYEMVKDVEVERVGFVLHPRIARSGASPDGLVGEDGLVEIKVPTTANHLRYLMEGVVPEQYVPQMMWQIACTERKWCDFCSYDPRLPTDFGLFIVRLDRDDEAIRDMEDKVVQFIAEVNALSEKLLASRKYTAMPIPVPAPAGPGPCKAIIP